MNYTVFSYGLRRADGSTTLRYKGVQLQQLKHSNTLSFEHLKNLLYNSPRSTKPLEPIRSAQHAVAECLALQTSINEQSPCIEVPVRGFTSAWKRQQPYQPPTPQPMATTRIISAEERYLGSPSKKRRISKLPPSNETCFLYEQQGARKQVQLQFARRSLIHPRVLNLHSPMLLYSTCFGYTPTKILPAEHADLSALARSD
jgi:hypothetical protein